MAKGKGIEARPRLFQLRPINFLARKESLLFFLLPLYAPSPLVMNTSFAGMLSIQAGKNKYPAVVKSALLLLVFRWSALLEDSLHFSRWMYTVVDIYNEEEDTVIPHSVHRAGLSSCTSETDCGFLNCADPPAVVFSFFRLNKAPLFPPFSHFLPPNRIPLRPDRTDVGFS